MNSGNIDLYLQFRLQCTLYMCISTIIGARVNFTVQYVRTEMLFDYTAEPHDMAPLTPSFARHHLAQFVRFDLALR